jgi:DNA-binding transcriptional MocR family regulator
MKLVTDHGTSTVSQIVALHLMDDLDAIRERRRETVRERKAMLERLLGEWLPGWTWDPPDGGLCLWVRIPVGDATSFALAATRHGVTVVPGPMTSVDGKFSDRIRLPFVLEPGAMRDGVERLASAWREYEAEADADAAPRAVRIVV